MYGLPENIDLRFLENAELLQVCIGVHELVLRFQDDIAITVMGKFLHESTAQAASPNASLAHFASTLTTLLEAKIVKVEATTDGTLRLCFSNKHRLTLYDDNPQYEAYTLTHGLRTIVV